MTAPLFAYDLGSPYAWLSAERVGAVLGEDIEWMPVLLGGLFRATGRSSWARTERRAAGIAEIEARARRYGLPPLRWPARWPNDGLRVMRVATFAHGRGAEAGRHFALTAFRVQFCDGVALEDEQGIVRACERAGLDPAEALAAAGDPDVKAQLRENTDRALATGVVGVPAVIVGDRVVWGDDRLEDAAALVAR